MTLGDSLDFIQARLAPRQAHQFSLDQTVIAERQRFVDQHLHTHDVEKLCGAIDAVGSHVGLPEKLLS
ncbi:hypothetical protein D3C87_2051100 [compost metagenome]